MVIHHNVLMYISFYTLKAPHCDKSYSFLAPRRCHYIVLCKRAFYKHLHRAHWHKCPDGCLESSGGCPGAEPFNGLFVLWTFTKPAVPRTGQCHFHTGWARMAFGIAKSFFGYFSVLAISRSGMGGKGAQRDSVIFTDHSWAVMRREKPAGAPLDSLCSVLGPLSRDSPGEICWKSPLDGTSSTRKSKNCSLFSQFFSPEKH